MRMHICVKLYIGATKPWGLWASHGANGHAQGKHSWGLCTHGPHIPGGFITIPCSMVTWHIFFAGFISEISSPLVLPRHHPAQCFFCRALCIGPVEEGFLRIRQWPEEGGCLYPPYVRLWPGSILRPKLPSRACGPTSRALPALWVSISSYPHHSSKTNCPSPSLVRTLARLMPGIMSGAFWLSPLGAEERREVYCNGALY